MSKWKIRDVGLSGDHEECIVHVDASGLEDTPGFAISGHAVLVGRFKLKPGEKPSERRILAAARKAVKAYLEDLAERRRTLDVLQYLGTYSNREFTL